jgi:predicted RNA-binding Zn ribbon-like protein
VAEPDKHPGFVFLGGRAPLDFANTVGGKRGVRIDESLTDYAALVRWASHAKLLGRSESARLLQQAGRHPERAERALESARDLREALHALFAAAAGGSAPPPADLALVNDLALQAHAERRLVPARRGFELRWSEREGDLVPFLRRLVLEAVELLASVEAAHVRVCAESEADRCDWVFLDESRGGKRRFCSMKDCGNRAKQRRHYRRVKVERSLE